MLPGEETVVLEVGDRKIDRWTSYSFNQSFLVPSDGWMFEMGGDSLAPDLLPLLKPGTKVKLTINDLVQCTGYIDRVDPNTQPGSGSTITIEGRDTFGPVVDAQIDPRKHWPDKQPLDKFIQETFEPFGFTTFFVDNGANVDAAAGKSVARRRKAKALSQYKLSQQKPDHGESFFTFISRVTQRQGLWVWPTTDGTGVIVSTPDFDQKPRFHIVNRRTDPSRNNVRKGGVARDYTGVPSSIVARGRVPGRTFERERLAVSCFGPIEYGGNPNDIDFVTDAELGQDLSKVKSKDGRTLAVIESETVVVKPPPIEWATEFASTVARPIFLTDDKSQTLDELKKFAQREMSLRHRHAVLGKYTAPGHTQNGVPWQIDSVCDVDDELSQWQRPMWIASRTFRKQRGSNGTTTELELLPLNSLVF